jgi:hypothetical protein
MEWWIIGIAVVLMIVVIYFVGSYFTGEEDHNSKIEDFSKMLLDGKEAAVKKKAKDSMEIYEAYQLALHHTK